VVLINMGIQICLLEPDKTYFSTKDMVISVLASQWPLSAKKIHYLIKKEYNPSISYHAVYKALTSLFKSRVLTKEAIKYKLNLSWIKSSKSVLDRIEKTYLGLNESSLKSTLSKLVFHSLEEAEFFLSEVYMKHKSDSIVCVEEPHLWWLLYYPEQGETSSYVDSKGYYSICNGNTLVDKWCEEIENKLLFNCKTGIPCAQRSKLIVFENFYVEIYFPKKLINKITQKYMSVKKITPSKMRELSIFLKELAQEKYDISIIIHRDKKLAQQHIGRIMSYFKVAKK